VQPPQLGESYVDMTKQVNLFRQAGAEGSFERTNFATFSATSYYSF